MSGWPGTQYSSSSSNSCLGRLPSQGLDPAAAAAAAAAPCPMSPTWCSRRSTLARAATTHATLWSPPTRVCGASTCSWARAGGTGTRSSGATGPATCTWTWSSAASATLGWTRTSWWTSPSHCSRGCTGSAGALRCLTPPSLSSSPCLHLHLATCRTTAGAQAGPPWVPAAAPRPQGQPLLSWTSSPGTWWCGCLDTPWPATRWRGPWWLS
mmetsp:Transcript_29598/g.65543  ORF Transcript_29598/g.65543 Transcript_29598/m.65543 type:complete len:211 (+) Transcript_29598:581-1213(+)